MTRAATAGAIAAAGLTAATAGAAGPSAGLLADDARDVPAVAEGQLVYAAADGAVWVVDAAGGRASRRELTRACAAAPGVPVVQAASGGYALLECASTAHPGQRQLLVLDLSSGALVEPALSGLDRLIGSGDRLEITGIAGTSLCYEITFDKGPRQSDRYAWGPGRAEPGVHVPCALRGGATAPVSRDGGVTVRSGATSRVAELTGCGATLSWSGISPDSRWQAVADGVAIADRATADGPVAIRYRSFADVCTRIAARWRLTVRADGVRTAVRPVTAQGHDRVTGAAIAWRPHGPESARRAFRVRHAAIVLGARARSVRWRLDGGRWHTALGAASRWRLDGVVPRRTGQLRLAVRFGDGGEGRYRVRLR